MNQLHALPDLARATELQVTVLASFADAERHRAAWDDLVTRSGADIYQSFDWCSLWWKHYGAGRRLQLLLCHRDGELVGVFPGFTESLWLGATRVRVAKMIGADFSLHLCNLAVLAETTDPVVRQIARHFVGQLRCDLLLFGPLAGNAARIEEIAAAARNEEGVVEQAEPLGNSCNTNFHLPATFDEYFAAIGKQQRGNFNRAQKDLAKAHQLSFDVISDPQQVVAEFESFREMHDAQWQAEGKLGHFGDWPSALPFNRDLVRTLGAKGAVRFYRILANGRVVSSQFSYVTPTTNYWRLPARVFGPEWDRFSFGRMGLVKMIEASIQAGQRMIEGGRGHYGYKLQLCGTEVPLRTIEVMRRGTGVRTRVKAFKLSAQALNLAYYKVLFMRIAPKVPAVRRPLLPTWIRSHW